MENNEIVVIVKEPKKEQEFAKVQNGKNDLSMNVWLKHKIGCNHLERVIIQHLGKDRTLVMYVDEDGKFNDSDLNIYIRMELLDRVIIDDVYGTIVFAIEKRVYTTYDTYVEFESIDDDETRRIINELLFESKMLEEMNKIGHQVNQPKPKKEKLSDRERVRGIYKQFKKDSNGDTELGLDFICFLHKEHNEARYLLGMEGLTAIEEEYIKHLIEEE